MDRFTDKIEEISQQDSQESQSHSTVPGTGLETASDLSEQSTLDHVHSPALSEKSSELHDDEIQRKRAQFYAEYPVSINGACPYCQSWNVQYLILKEVYEMGCLPETLEKLSNVGRAIVVDRSEGDMQMHAQPVPYLHK